MTVAALSAENRIADLEEQVNSLQRTIDTLLQNGLNPLLITPGTLRFGGNIMQLDRNGIQVAAADTRTTSVFFVERLVPAANTSGVPRATLSGAVSSGGIPDLYVGAINSSGAETFLFVRQDGVFSTFEFTLDDTHLFDLDLLDSRVVLNAAVVSSGILRLGGDTSDPSVQVDGDISFRADTFKFRGRANSTTENFAFESYVDSAVAAPPTTWALSADITPSQITATQNDYNPTGLSTASVLRLSTDASRDITGLAGGVDGRVILIFNVGSFDIVLKDENAGSTSVYRFALDGDITLAPDTGAVLWYDTITERWRCAGRYSAGGGAGDVATDTLWDALGDLAVGTGANTANNLPVGTDGYVLTADSTDLSFGIKWAPAAGGPGGSTSIARTLMLMGA